ncbi:MAG: hypothetical protein Q9220_004545 [cf. Caloplaca sp. 1 TL-2023]
MPTPVLGVSTISLTTEDLVHPQPANPSTVLLLVIVHVKSAESGVIAVSSPEASSSADDSPALQISTKYLDYRQFCVGIIISTHVPQSKGLVLDVNCLYVSQSILDPYFLSFKLDVSGIKAMRMLMSCDPPEQVPSKKVTENGPVIFLYKTFWLSNMKVPVNKQKKSALASFGSLRDEDKWQASDGSSDTMHNEPLLPGQQQTLPLKRHRPDSPLNEGSRSGDSDRHNQRRMLLCVYSDRNGPPGNFVVETDMLLKSYRQELKKALAPLAPSLWEEMRKSSGTCNVDKKTSTAPVGVVKREQRKLIKLPYRKKGGNSPPRHSKASTHRLSTAQCAQEIDVQISDTEDENVDCTQESESEDDEPISTDPVESSQANNRKEIQKYYREAFRRNGQTYLKKILKLWIKVKQPRKQTTYPYNGRKPKALQEQERAKGDIDDNPGLLTAPPWWPSQHGCRHKEPDHTKKEERLILVVHLLRLTAIDEPNGFTTARLRAVTDKIEKVRPEQVAVLHEVYRLREIEERVEDQATDGTEVIYFRDFPPQPPRKKKQPIKKPEPAQEIKEEPPRSSGMPDPGMTQSEFDSFTTVQSSEPQSLNTSFSSSSSSVPIKVERVAQDVGYTGVAAGFPPYAATTTSDSPPSNHFQPTIPSITQIPPRNDHLFNESFGYLPDPRGRIAERYSGNRYPRSASVMKQASPSYDDWIIPFADGYDFPDDTCLKGFQKATTSVGRPTEGLAYPLASPRNHAHGLNPVVQQQVCASQACPHGHSHGGRLQTEQQQLCFGTGCPQDPGQQTSLEQPAGASLPATHYNNSIFDLDEYMTFTPN